MNGKRLWKDYYINFAIAGFVLIFVLVDIVSSYREGFDSGRLWIILGGLVIFAVNLFMGFEKWKRDNN